MLREEKRLQLLCLFLLSAMLFLIPKKVYSQEYLFEIESGLLWFSYNDVQIPGAEGTEFNMLDLIGTEPIPFAHLKLYVTFRDNHTFRLNFAPVRKLGTGTFDEPVF